ncbi:MAG TPA: hypothetical protein VIQ02_15130, partial [Jiangellaceae bacterium]
CCRGRSRCLSTRRQRREVVPVIARSSVPEPVTSQRVASQPVTTQRVVSQPIESPEAGKVRLILGGTASSTLAAAVRRELAERQGRDGVMALG